MKREGGEEIMGTHLICIMYAQKDQTDRQTDRQTVRETDRLADRQTDRQTD